MSDTPGAPLTPEDIPSLSVEHLATSGEYLALASVAMFGGNQDPHIALNALNALAARAEDPQAFRWWWRTVMDAPRRSDNWLASSTKLSQQISVPEDLQSEVSATVLEQPPGHVRQQTVEQVMREEVFARLDPSSEMARQVAVRVLDEPSSAQMATTAVAVLGASEDAQDRALVLARAQRTSPPDVAVLVQLRPPLRDDEPGVFRAAVQQRLRNLDNVHAADASTLMSRLPLSDVAELLLAAPDAVTTLVSGGALVQKLGTRPLQQLLEDLNPPQADTSDAADTVTAGLLDRVSSIGEDAPAMALWAAKRFGVDSVRTYRQELVRTAESSWGAVERRFEARRRFIEFFAHGPSDSLVAEAAGILNPDDMTGPGVSALPAASRRGLGRALAKAVAINRLGDRVVVDALVRLADEQSLAEAVPLVGGFLSASPSPQPELVDLLTNPASVPEAVEAGLSGLVATALGERGLPVGERVDAVGAATVGQDSDVAAFVELVEPHELTAEAADALAAHLRLRPALLATLCERLLVSLTGPESLAVPAQALAPILAERVEVGALDELKVTGAVRDAAAAAAHIPGRILEDPLAAWLAEAPLEGDALEVAIAADEGHTDVENPFRKARTNLAHRYAKRAQEGSHEIDERVEDLKTAQQADAAVAREAAFTLVTAPNPVLRRTAAEVLGSSDGRAEEADRLEELLGQETDRIAGDQLRSALRRIRSGDVGQALHNLLELLEIDRGGPGFDVQVYLPYQAWHDTFTRCVDDVRSAVTTNPPGVAQAAIRLGELLVEQAVATRLLSSKKESERQQGQLLLENATNKQAIGTLLNRQDLLQALPWMHAYAALRETRSVHPAPRGKTTPVSAGAADGLSLGLLKTVAEGWLSAIAESRLAGHKVVSVPRTHPALQGVRAASLGSGRPHRGVPRCQPLLGRSSPPPTQGDVSLHTFGSEVGTDLVCAGSPTLELGLHLCGVVRLDASRLRHHVLLEVLVRGENVRCDGGDVVCLLQGGREGGEVDVVLAFGHPGPVSERLAGRVAFRDASEQDADLTGDGLLV